VPGSSSGPTAPDCLGTIVDERYKIKLNSRQGAPEYLKASFALDREGAFNVMELLPESFMKIDEKKEHHPIYHLGTMYDAMILLKAASINYFRNSHQFS
jgi:hypothetical protein